MFSLIIVTILAGVATGIPVNSTDPAQVEATVNSTLQCVENYLSGQQNNSTGSDIQDPLVIPEIEIDLDILDGLIPLGYVVLNNVTLSGIKNVQKNFSTEYDEQDGGVEVDIELTWPLLSVTGSYEANVTAGDLKIEGNGKFDVDVSNIIAEGGVEYTSDGTLVIVEAGPYVGNVQFQIDGLLINGEDRSEWVSEVLSNTTNKTIAHSQEIEAIIGAVISTIQEVVGSGNYIDYALGLAGTANTLIDCTDP